MKSDDKTRDLLDTGSMISAGYAYLAANAGRAIAVITLLVAALVTFTEVAFADVSGGVLTPTVITLLIASYTMYFSLEDAGERLGEESEEYKAAISRYSGMRARISADMIPALQDFCHSYSACELRARRRELLVEYGISDGEYEAFLSGKKYDPRRTLAMKKIKAARGIRLTPAILLSRDRRPQQASLKNPERARLAKMLVGMIPTTVFTFFTASLILTVRDSLTAEVVLDGLLKLSSLLLVGFRGYTGGYSYVKGKAAGWLDAKATVLESFLLTQNSEASTG